MTTIAKVLDRLRGGASENALIDQLLARGEAELRDGGDPERIRAAGREALVRLAHARAGGETSRRRGAAHLLAGNLDDAARHAFEAADRMPYDVDSRIALGNARLARGELDAAAHEFDEVIGEFGAEGEAAAGRRAAILARGHAPVDELPASDDDWREAARLLAGLWRVCGILDQRLAALGGAHPDTLALLRTAAGREGSDGPA